MDDTDEVNDILMRISSSGGIFQDEDGGGVGSIEEVDKI